MATYFPQPNALQTNIPSQIAQNFGNTMLQSNQLQRQGMLDQNAMKMQQYQLNRENTLDKQAAATAEQEHKFKTLKTAYELENSDLANEFLARNGVEGTKIKFSKDGKRITNFVTTPNGDVKIEGGKADVKDYMEYVRTNPGIPKNVLSQEAAKRGISIEPSQQATKDTDIDDFVSDADKENFAQTGKHLTPGERNKARLQIKRAQSEEVSGTRLALRNADAATAKKIKFNEKYGARLAEIQTEADLLKAKGEMTPQAKIGNAQKRMTGNLAKLSEHYVNLDSLGAIINVDKTTAENVFAAAKSSTIGQQFGRITGSNEQSIRNSIKKIKPLLIQDIRQATDMGARGLDSEKELEFYLQAATDEKTDIQSNIAAIVVLDEAYGTGEIAETLKGMTNESLIQRISSEGQKILQGDKKQNNIVEVRNPSTGEMETWNLTTETRIK